MGCRFMFLTHLNKKEPTMSKKDKHTTEDHCTMKVECTVTEVV